MPSVRSAIFSALEEKALVYFSNIARLSSRICMNIAAPTVLAIIIGSAMCSTSCNASS